MANRQRGRRTKGTIAGKAGQQRRRRHAKAAVKRMLKGR